MHVCVYVCACVGLCMHVELLAFVCVSRTLPSAVAFVEAGVAFS